MTNDDSVFKRVAAFVAIAVPFAFMGWFFAWPLVAIMGRGFMPHGHLQIGAFGDVFSEARTRRIIVFTFTQAALSTVGALALGIPLAYCLERRPARGATIAKAIVMLPFALPTIVVASAFSSLFGAGSPLAAWHLVPSTVVIILAHIFFNLAVVVRVVGARWATFDDDLLGAAAVLGASKIRTTRTVTWPLLAPSIVGAASIVFLFCATSFGVVLVLGGARQATIETEIYRLTTQELALNRAAVLVVVQMIAVFATLRCAARADRNPAATAFSFPETQRRTRRSPTRQGPWSTRRVGRGQGFRIGRSRGFGRRRTVVGWYVYQWTVAALIVVPLALIVARSMSSSGVGYRTLIHDSTFGGRPIASVVVSLQMAVVATVIAMCIGTLSSVAIVLRSRATRVLNGILLLPLGISAVTIGFGFLIALDRPVDLRGHWFIVPIAQAMVALPFVVRLLVPTLRGVDLRMRDAAMVLGARPWRVVRTIDVPIVRRGVAAAVAFAAAISLGEFGATTMIARSDHPTIPLEIARLLARPGNATRAGAFALAVVLIMVTGALVLIAERLTASNRSV